MPNDTIPHAAERLISGLKWSNRPIDFGRLALRERVTLRNACDEMVSRILDETDDCRFPSLDAQIQISTDLCQRANFNFPPVEPILYVRGENWNATGTETADFGQGKRILAHPFVANSAFVRVWGYRFFDPADSDLPKEIYTAAIVESSDPTKPATFDPWASMSRTDDRNKAVQSLRQWTRAIDGMPEMIEQTMAVAADKQRRALRACAAKAWSEYQTVIQSDPSLADAPPKTIYQHVKTKARQTGEAGTLPALNTWLRYFREAKAYHPRG